MKTCGIVVEYNPFHNGHLIHIEKSREQSGCECLIAVMSGNYVQRGEFAIADKWQRTECALEHGVDLVVELPLILTLQSATVFGENSAGLLKLLGVDHIAFGSETANLEELQKIASLPVNVNYLKERMRKGESYPKAYGLLSDSVYPNDRLAICYLRALLDSDVKPLAIKRNDNANDEMIDTVCSARAIRKAVLNGQDYHNSTPMEIRSPVCNADLWPYLRRLLIMSDRESLEKIFLVREGIEKMLKDNAEKYENYEDFLRASISKRYTRGRIQRTLMQIVLGNKKEEVSALSFPGYLRVLGFNATGRQFLKEYEGPGKVITTFKEIPPSYKLFEERGSKLYASLFPEEKRKELLKRELQGPIIKMQ